MNFRTRIIACICIISVLLSLIIFSEAVISLKHDPQYTAFSDDVATTAGVYFTENWNNEGHIYLVDSTGKVLKMLGSESLKEERIHAVDMNDGKVYGLFSSYMEEEDKIYTVYRIFEFTSGLKQTGKTRRIRLEDQVKVTDLAMDKDGFKIVTITLDGVDLNVYQVPLDDVILFEDLDDDEKSALKEQEEEEKPSDIEVPDNIVFRESPDGEFFVDAQYRDGQLYVRTDQDTPTGIFQPDSRVKSAIDKIHFSLGQKLSLYHKYVLYWAGGIIIWFILMGLLLYVLRRRNRFVYVVILTELIYLIILAGSFYFAQREYKKAGTQEFSKFAVLALQGELDSTGDLDRIDFDSSGYFESQEYSDLETSLSRFASRQANVAVFRDVFVMRLKDMVMLTGISGHNRENASWMYGGGMSKLDEELYSKHRSFGAATVMVEGQEFLAVGVTDGSPTTKYALVGIISSTDPNLGIWGDTRALIIMFLIVFALGSILMLVALWLQGADLRRFEKAIREVALGGRHVDLPNNPAQDMQSMWNSLAEVTKRIEEINYEKFRIFEAYYRFAPKNIETIMGRESIFDVKNGDITKASGSLLLMTTQRQGFGEDRLKSLNNIVSYMEQYSAQKEGILVSQDSSLSVLEFLFLEGFKEITKQVTQFIHRNMADKDSGDVSVFLYHDSFIYGVVGINEHSLAYLYSERAKELELYAKWFRDLKINMVITEEIRRREDTGEVRYIGYVVLEGENSKLNLYEVLDACPARERQLKLMLKEKFESTIQLFYNRDFYIARNRFTEIIKECPDDEITKWYLFASERYLNEGLNTSEDFGELKYQ